MAIDLFTIGLSVVACLVAAKLIPILSLAWDRKLARIPNAHWSAPYCKAWLVWNKWHGREFTARNTAHEKYGPIVRVAPNDVSVNCVEGGIKTAWGSWDKTGFYANFEYSGVRPTFSVLEAKPHTAQKKMLAAVYTKSYIDNSPEVVKIMKTINKDRFLPFILERATEKASVDVLWLSESYFMDATSAYLYGLHNSTDFIRNENDARSVLRAFEISLGPDLFWLAEFPRITAMLAKIGVSLVPSRVFECFPVYEGFGFGLGEKTRKNLGTKKSDGLISEPVVFNHFREKLSQTDMLEENADNLVSAEMLDHLHAAHEASGCLVTYLYYELSRNMAVQDEFIEELRQLKTAGKALESSSLLEDLLLETMRVYPPANGPFPRVCPAGGSQIGGFDIPGGTEVSASPYTLGRNAKIFPNPDKWDPKRWTRATPAVRREMQQWVWVFGTGARACIGRHFAELTIKSMVTTLYVNFRTRLAKPDATDMEPVQAMMALPKGHELKLIFESL